MLIKISQHRIWLMVFPYNKGSIVNLLKRNSTAGACISASTALCAHIGINLIDITFGDCAHRAFVFTSTACNAVGRNFVSHSNKNLLNSISIVLCRKGTEFFCSFKKRNVQFYKNSLCCYFFPARAARSFWLGVVLPADVSPFCLAYCVQFFAPPSASTGRPSCRKWQ